MGMIDDAKNAVSSAAASVADMTRDTVRSGVASVRSVLDNIELTDKDITLLSTDPALQMSREAFDGILKPEEQKVLIKKVLQIKSRGQINDLLSQIKSTELASLVKSYSFPVREK